MLLHYVNEYPGTIITLCGRVEHGRTGASPMTGVEKWPDGFSEGPIEDVVIHKLSAHKDPRGWLVELYREDELPTERYPAMAYVSETLPGAARGPHEHVTQSDYFAFVGPGEFELYLWDGRPDSPTRGNRMKVAVGESNRQCVIVPPGVVHAYKNIGAVPGWVFNAPNQLYAGAGKRGPVDEIRHEDQTDSPYRLD
jgi:dTDP-4-dehydrorhamnose 3,5-epimerase